MRTIATARLAVAALATLSFSGAAAGVAQPPQRTYTIVIDKMKFGAVPATLRVGDTIVWVNRDLFRHTATASDRSFDIDLLPGRSAKMVLKRAGNFRFFCTYHPGMKGRMTIIR